MWTHQTHAFHPRLNISHAPELCPLCITMPSTVQISRWILHSRKLSWRGYPTAKTGRRDLNLISLVTVAACDRQTDRITMAIERCILHSIAKLRYSNIQYVLKFVWVHWISLVFHLVVLWIFGYSQYRLNLFARWHQRVRFKRWGDWGVRVSVGGWNCKIMFLGRSSYSLIQTLLL